MTTFTLTNDDSPNLKFKGEKIAEASDHWIQGQDQTRWTELDLYRTEGGKFVCQESGISQWQGESSSHRAAAVETEEEVIKFFGQSALAKEIYSDANINAAVEID